MHFAVVNMKTYEEYNTFTEVSHDEMVELPELPCENCEAPCSGRIFASLYAGPGDR